MLARGPDDEAAAWARVRAEVAEGHQAYVVTPLIEDSEKLDVRSATETFDRLQSGELAGLRLGLLHGRVGAKEKEQVMEAFRAGEVDVLVATTVIEVGVDVPNATVMVVLDADRFGMAQLHQLRGRVGRGGAMSWCHLLTTAAVDELGTEAEERLAALARTTDGFELAEVDLDLRGEGMILGTRQKGRSGLRLASLRRDREMVAVARSAALALVDGPGGLEAYPALVEEVDGLLEPDDESAEENLFKS